MSESPDPTGQPEGQKLIVEAIGDVRDFLSFIGIERGRSANTRLAYETDLIGFVEFVATLHLSARSATYLDLRRYLAHLRSRELTSRTIARKVSALKQFYLFLLREERIQSDPAELLSVLVKDRILPKHLTLREVIRLLDVPDTGHDSGTRDRALLEFWYATGCRVSELVKLRTSDLDWTGGVAKLRGKGARERLVPLNREAQTWCRSYALIRHGWVQQLNQLEREEFFLTDRAQPFTRQRLWKKVKELAAGAGIERPVWPHMIRHSFATHVLQGGADLRVVQEMLGHRSIATTEIYTHLDPEDLKSMQRKFHPRS